jgi:hypothetical protein
MIGLFYWLNLICTKWYSFIELKAGGTDFCYLAASTVNQVENNHVSLNK